MSYIEYEGNIQETYLDLINLEKKTSEYICNSINTFFINLNIWDNVIFVSTDGENSRAG